VADLTVTFAQLPEDFVRDPDERADSCIQQNDICPGWAIDNLGDRYLDPTIEHLELVMISVVAGFAIAFALALLAHRNPWLGPPLLGITGVLYTIPAVAAIFLLIPITGFSWWTAIIPLAAYNLQVIYRNVLAGLANVPAAAKSAGRGMGLTQRQLLWKVELPLALPETFAGLRIATVSTVAIASLAGFVGVGLGTEILDDIDFKTGVLVAGTLLILMAFALDAILFFAQRLITPWRRVEQR
jgi:osmoprotectant transport system permease protein